MKPFKGTLIGAGYFAQFHADAWKRLEGVALTAVCDAVPGKARAFADRFNLPHAYESVPAMLAAECPDFVDIATRPDTHLPLTRLAAERGVHVICQKPMAPTPADCVAMCELCEANGVRLLIHENWRWQPWYRAAGRLIASGALGELRRLTFDWRTGDGTGPEPYAAQPYFRAMPRLLIYESLVHILDTFRFLGGELRVTGCETRRINPVIAGEDWAEIHVAFDSGAAGFIHGDRHTGPVPAPVAMGEMAIEGSLGTLRITPEGRLAGTAASVAPAPSSIPFGVAGAASPLAYKGDSVLATQQHLLDCLRTGQRCESEGRNYLRTVALVEAAYELCPVPKTP